MYRLVSQVNSIAITLLSSYTNITNIWNISSTHASILIHTDMRVLRFIDKSKVARSYALLCGVNFSSRYLEDIKYLLSFLDNNPPRISEFLEKMSAVSQADAKLYSYYIASIIRIPYLYKQIFRIIRSIELVGRVGNSLLQIYSTEPLLYKYLSSGILHVHPDTLTVLPAIEVEKLLYDENLSTNMYETLLHYLYIIGKIPNTVRISQKVISYLLEFDHPSSTISCLLLYLGVNKADKSKYKHLRKRLGNKDIYCKFARRIISVRCNPDKIKSVVIKILNYRMNTEYPVPRDYFDKLWSICQGLSSIRPYRY